MAAPSYHQSIAAISWRDSVYAFGIEDAGNVVQWNSSGIFRVTDFANLGGISISPPVVVASDSGYLLIFVLGADRTAQVKWYGRKTWFPSPTTWTSLGGRFSSSCAAVSLGPNGVHLFGRADDSSYLHAYVDIIRDGYRVLDWENLGGSFAGAPAAVGFYPKSLYVVGREINGGYSLRLWDSRGRGQWKPFQNLGGSLVGDPSIVKTDETRAKFAIFGIAQSGLLKVKYVEDAVFKGPWQPLPGLKLSSRLVQGASFIDAKRYDIIRHRSRQRALSKELDRIIMGAVGEAFRASHK